MKQLKASSKGGHIRSRFKVVNGSQINQLALLVSTGRNPALGSNQGRVDSLNLIPIIRSEASHSLGEVTSVRGFGFGVER